MVYKSAEEGWGINMLNWKLGMQSLRQGLQDFYISI